MKLQQDALTAYRRDGFWLERGFLDAATCGRIHKRGMALVGDSATPHRIMNPHGLDSLFLEMLRQPRIVAAIEEFCGETALGVQTMFYIKPPGSTGHGWHQDNFYITGEPKPVLAAWCALDRITEENGALVVFPGSHTNGHYPMVPHTNENFKNHAVAIAPPPQFPARLVEMRCGDVLFFDGKLIHGSYPNRSPRDQRPAYIAHYLPQGSVLEKSKGDRVSLHG